MTSPGRFYTQNMIAGNGAAYDPEQGIQEASGHYTALGQHFCIYPLLGQIAF